MNMSDRDAIWSVYLYYQYGEKTIVDRLVEWAWMQKKLIFAMSRLNFMRSL